MVWSMVQALVIVFILLPVGLSWIGSVIGLLMDKNWEVAFLTTLYASAIIGFPLGLWQLQQ